MAATNTVCMHLMRRTARMAMAGNTYSRSMKTTVTNNLTAPAFFSTSQKPVNNRHKTPAKSEMKTEQSLTADGAMTKTRKFPEPFIPASIDPTIRYYQAEEGREVMPPAITFSNGFTWSETESNK